MLVRKLLKIQTLLLIPVLYFIWWLNFDLDRRVRALTNEALRDAKLNIANPAALIKKSKEESAYENPEDEEEYVINENDDEDEEEKEDLQPAQVKKQNYSIETEFRWHMEQDRRKETLRRACKNIPFTPLKDLTEKFSRNLFFLAVDDRHEAMYCFIPKVSCSTWLSLWILLNEDDKTWEDNLNPHAHTYGLLRRKPSASEMYYKITTYTKFILVRHPFERLLSAYRAKFESPVNKPAVIYRRTYGVNIAAKYRTEPVNSTLLGFITFKELVAYILDKYPRKNDRHWERYSRLCNPCAIEYDIIGKYETLKLDSDHFLDRIGAKPELRYPNEKKTNTSGLVNSYLETLTNKQIDGLLKLYKNDFNLFGYKKARRIE